MLRLLLLGPWYVKATIAAVMLGLAVVMYTFGLDQEAEKAKARDAGLPAAVALDSFDPKRDVHPADEVHVIGWINPDFNYELTETRQRKTGSYDVVRRMFVLFGPGDSADSREARAAILMTAKQADDLIATMPDLLESISGDSFSFRLNAQWTDSPDLENMAEDAFKEQGLRKAANFLYMEPWAGGRDVALRPDMKTVYLTTGGFSALGALFGLIAFFSFRRSRARAAALSELDLAMAQHRAAQSALGAVDPAGMPADISAPVTPAKAQKKSARKMFLICLGIVGLVALARSGAANYIGTALTLIVLAAILIGVQRLKNLVGQAISGGAGPALASLMPKPAPAPLQDGPIQTTLRASEQLSAKGGKWLPFAVGAAMLGGAAFFNLLPEGALPSLPSGSVEIAALPEPVAAADTAAPAASPVVTEAPDLADAATLLPFGVVPASLLTIALVMLGLLALRVTSRRAGGRDEQVPHDRWTRIAQEARR